MVGWLKLNSRLYTLLIHFPKNSYGAFQLVGEATFVTDGR
jgi:hypothetical protein